MDYSLLIIGFGSMGIIYCGLKAWDSYREYQRTMKKFYFQLNHSTSKAFIDGFTQGFIKT